MARILGIDPGSRATGYGVIETGERGVGACLAHGVIQLPRGPLAPRLGRIHDELARLMEEHRPEEAAVERVFMARNADSALKLGHARGAALVACVAHGLSVTEYTPAAVKQALVGNGRAAKGQIGYMVRALLRLREAPAEDAADALAVACCHAQHRSSPLAAAAASNGEEAP